MAETKINASQTTITASDIGAARATTVLPTASASEAGNIYQFVGATNANYTNGYFYKCVQELVMTGPVPEASSENTVTLNVDNAAFADYLQSKSITITEPTSFYIVMEADSETGDVYPALYMGDEETLVEAFPTEDEDWEAGDYVGDTGIYLAPYLTEERLDEANFPNAGAENTIGFVVDMTSQWERIDVQPGVAYTAGTGIDITNNAISVDDTVLVNNPTGTSSVNIKGSNNNQSNSVAVGSGATVTNNQGVAVGWGSQAGYDCTAVGAGSVAYDDYSTAIGFGATVPYGVAYAIQLGNGTNNTSGTMAVALSTGSGWTNYELLSSDGTIPEARLADTASAQQGDVLTLDGNGNAVWQAGGSGGGLPSQTGNTGKFLTTDGTDASWSDTPLVNKSSNTNSVVSLKSKDSGTAFTSSGVAIFGIHIGYSNNIKAGNNTVAVCSGEPNFGNGSCTVMGYSAYISDKITNSIAIGASSTIWGSNATTGQYNVAIGSSAKIGELAQAHISYAIQLGRGTNTDANTFKVGLGSSNNYELLSADGTIPTARLTKVNSTITLTAAGWSSNSQTVNVTGMTATGVVFVSPDPTDQADYTSAGILCTAQAAGTLTFTCDTVPSGDIDVNVVML